MVHIWQSLKVKVATVLQRKRANLLFPFKILCYSQESIQIYFDFVGGENKHLYSFVSILVLSHGLDMSLWLHFVSQFGKHFLVVISPANELKIKLNVLHLKIHKSLFRFWRIKPNQCGECSAKCLFQKHKTFSYKLTTHYQLRPQICTVCGQCPSDATLQISTLRSFPIWRYKYFASKPLKGIMHLIDSLLPRTEENDFKLPLKSESDKHMTLFWSRESS